MLKYYRLTCRETGANAWCVRKRRIRTKKRWKSDCLDDKELERAVNVYGVRGRRRLEAEFEGLQEIRPASDDHDHNTRF
jgi:hypothetical protein